MRRTKAMILCALFAALAAVGAFLRIPVPLVPFTLQFLFTNLAGLLLGKKLGAVSVGVYVLLGLMGLPIFTGGGGIGYLVHPTFGYLIGFILGAGLVCPAPGRQPFFHLSLGGFFEYGRGVPIGDGSLFSDCQLLYPFPHWRGKPVFDLLPALSPRRYRPVCAFGGFGPPSASHHLEVSPALPQSCIPPQEKPAGGFCVITRSDPLRRWGKAAAAGVK